MTRARTVEEMRFAAGLEPCPRCGSRTLGTMDVRNNGRSWSLTGKCPSCGAPRTFEFTATSDPTHARIGRYDLGASKSDAITPAQFLSVFDEAIARVPENPNALEPDLRAVADEELRRALICVSELMKLLPLGANSIPGASDTRLTRSWLSAEYKRLRMLAGRYAAPSSISDAALAAHHAYVNNGAKGKGQLVLDGRQLVRELYGAVDLTFVEIARSNLTAIDLAEARLERALLEQDVLTFANVRAANFVSAVIRGGVWTSVNASSAKFNDAELTGVDFSRSDFEGSLWYDARVSECRFDGVRFGSAVFDRASFQKCSFLDASFALFTSTPEPTSDRAQFTDCDLRNSDWSGRNLRGTTFLRCKLAGSTGKPASTDGLVLTDCDVDKTTFVAQLQRPLN